MKIRVQGSGFGVQAVSVIIILLCLASNVYAHKVSIYAYAEDGMVFSEGYFADGSRSRNSRVEVVEAETGKKLLEGTTDDNGRFSFKIPGVASLRLILHAGMGHQNDYTLSREEITEAMEKGPEAGDQGPVVNRRETEDNPGVSVPPAAVPGVSPSEIEAVVEKAVDRKLRPVLRILLALKENSEKPGITEIIGGIGYIMGLMGTAMYFKSRKAK